jgi:hypothetical protein
MRLPQPESSQILSTVRVEKSVDKTPNRDDFPAKQARFPFCIFFVQQRNQLIYIRIFHVAG